MMSPTPNDKELKAMRQEDETYYIEETEEKKKHKRKTKEKEVEKRKKQERRQT